MLNLSYAEFTAAMEPAEASRFAAGGLLAPGPATVPMLLPAREHIFPCRIVSWHGEHDLPENFGDHPLIRGWCGGSRAGWPSWDAYVNDCLDPRDRSRLCALRAHIIANDIRNGGFWHHREGIPKFSDGSMLFLSMRAWGDLMATIWGGSYVDYAWSDE